MSEIVLFEGVGFIGTHLTKRLLDRGHDVLHVVLSAEKIPDLLSNAEIQFYKPDITDEKNDPRTYAPATNHN